MNVSHKAKCIALTTFFTVSLFALESISPYYSFGLSPEVVSGPQGTELPTRDVMVKVAKVIHEETHEPKNIVPIVDSTIESVGFNIEINAILTALRKILLENEDVLIREEAAKTLGKIGIKSKEVLDDLYMVVRGSKIEAELDAAADEAMKILDGQDVGVETGKATSKHPMSADELHEIISRKIAELKDVIEAEEMDIVFSIRKVDEVLERTRHGYGDGFARGKSAELLTEIRTENEEIDGLNELIGTLEEQDAEDDSREGAGQHSMNIDDLVDKLSKDGVKYDKTVRALRRIAIKLEELLDYIHRIKNMPKRIGNEIETAEEVLAGFALKKKRDEVYDQYAKIPGDKDSAEMSLANIRKSLIDGETSGAKLETAEKLVRLGATDKELIDALREFLFFKPNIQLSKDQRQKLLKLAGSLYVWQIEHDDGSDARIRAAEALGEAGIMDEVVIADLRKAFFGDENHLVKIAAMTSLGLLGFKEEAIEYLRSILENPEAKGKLYATECLFKLGEKAEAAAYILKVLGSEKDEGIKFAYLRSLGELLKDIGKRDIPSEEKQDLWQCVNELKGNRIEIFIPQSMKLTASMEKTIREVNAGNKKDASSPDILSVRRIRPETLLDELPQKAAPGVKRIIIANDQTREQISALLKNDANRAALILRDVRIVQINMPDEVFIAKQARRLDLPEEAIASDYQAKALQIAILGRLLEFDGGEYKNIHVKITLDAILEDLLGTNVNLNQFLRTLGATETEETPAEEILERLNYFIGADKAVSLIRELHTDLIILKEFWTYA